MERNSRPFLCTYVLFFEILRDWTYICRSRAVRHPSAIAALADEYKSSDTRHYINHSPAQPIPPPSPIAKQTIAMLSLPEELKSFGTINGVSSQSIRRPSDLAQRTNAMLSLPDDVPLVAESS